MTTAAGDFWAETERYHELAEHFKRNIEVTHPDYVSTDRLCPFPQWCKWHRTAVIYQEYRGENVISF